jgi:hypothetical protein
MDPIIFKKHIDELCVIKRKGSVKSRDDAEPLEDSQRIAARPCSETCGDCGLKVTGRIVDYSVWKFGTPEQCWRKNCRICLKKTFI